MDVNVMIEACSHQIYFKNSLAELNVLIAARFTELARIAIEKQGAFHVALSGGVTPRAFYQLLASASQKVAIPWAHVYFYQTDERFVPFEHEDNNYKMIQSNLLDDLSLLPTQCYRMDTTLSSPAESAKAYEQVLKQRLPLNEFGYPQFDFVLLGLGTDGHIASLFPGTDALSAVERFVVDVFVKEINAWRISLTFNALNHAKQVVFLIAGKNKASVVEHLFRTDSPVRYPVQALKTVSPIEWYIDFAAASKSIFFEIIQ